MTAIEIEKLQQKVKQLQSALATSESHVKELETALASCKSEAETHLLDMQKTKNHLRVADLLKANPSLLNFYTG